ncbi:Mating-type protein a-1 [Smittium culicis]|uniref:Mating-type protein a-1 n=1 Tax=Smittium culicis TaxID=133412 RepID=A0A1R1YIH2_9FUNG|nr:Mating-type protein a-1 [Smittium culicis]
MENSNNISLCKPKKYKCSGGIEYVERYPDHYVLFIPNNISQTEIINRISLCSVDKKKKKPKSNRANNSFILYRMDKKQEIVSSNPNMNQKYVSQICASMWKNEPPSVREKYKAKYEELKAHQRCEKRKLEDDSMDCIKVESLLTKIQPASTDTAIPNTTLVSSPFNQEIDLNNSFSFSFSKNFDNDEISSSQVDSATIAPNMKQNLGISDGYISSRRRSLTMPGLMSKSMFETINKAVDEAKTSQINSFTNDYKNFEQESPIMSDIFNKDYNLAAKPISKEKETSIQLGDWISKFSAPVNTFGASIKIPNSFNKPKMVKLSTFRPANSSSNTESKPTAEKFINFDDQTVKNTNNAQNLEYSKYTNIHHNFDLSSIFGCSDPIVCNNDSGNQLTGNNYNVISGLLSKNDSFSNETSTPNFSQDIDPSLNFDCYNFNNFLTMNHPQQNTNYLSQNMSDSTNLFNNYQFDFSNAAFDSSSNIFNY